MSDIDANKDKPNRGKTSKRIPCGHNGHFDNCCFATNASASAARNYTTNRDPIDIGIADFNCDGFNDMALQPMVHTQLLFSPTMELATSPTDMMSGFQETHPETQNGMSSQTFNS
jgi:hypothetical protein